MKATESECESRDVLSNPLATAIVYWLPILALIVSGAIDIGAAWRIAVWVAALTTMGVGCLANAIRCGRMHCYFTGPFFLILALIALLYGLGLVQLGVRGWSTISLTLLVGALLLYYVPEAIAGRYRGSR